MNAAEVKQALRGRHPALAPLAGPGEWTCLEEFLSIDLLAVSAWSGAKRVGYEVKVSRTDYRRELLKPHKRVQAVGWCDEFYFAVPHGLLTLEEIDYAEPEWEDGDFSRADCPNRALGHYTWGWRGRRSRCVERVPSPDVLAHDWQKYGTRDERHSGQCGWREIPCRVCGGAGTVGKSRVERDAPTLWVPRDVGLAVVTSRGVSIAKAAPRKPRPSDHAAARERKLLAQIVRHASYRPDPRHAGDRAVRDAA